jgi:hypothetical protein
VTKDPISAGSSEITVEARREPAAPPLTSDQSVDGVSETPPAPMHRSHQLKDDGGSG